MPLGHRLLRMRTPSQISNELSDDLRPLDNRRDEIRLRADIVEGIPIKSNRIKLPSPRLLSVELEPPSARHLLRIAMMRNYSIEEIVYTSTLLSVDARGAGFRVAKCLRLLAIYCGGDSFSIDFVLGSLVGDDSIRSADDLRRAMSALGARAFFWRQLDESFPSPREWLVLKSSMGAIEVLTYANRGPEHANLTRSMSNYAIPEERTADEFLLVNIEHAYKAAAKRVASVNKDTKGSSRSPLNSPYKIREIIVEYSKSLLRNSIEAVIVSEILARPPEMNISGLASIGGTISGFRADRQRSFVERLLRESLTPLFQEAGLDEARRTSFTEELTDRLIGEARETASSNHAQSRPLPTAEEIEREGWRYSDLNAPGRAGRPKAAEARSANEAPIIKHLQSYWMPWIESGQLSRPTLRNLDRSAYDALSTWVNRSGNDLKAALGHDIPTRSVIARATLTPESIREARRIVKLSRPRTGDGPGR